MGWISMVVESSNFSAIRVIRVIRPLRTINSIPSMKKLVHGILNSLPAMFDVFLLLMFFLLVCSTVASQLFGGILSKRCAIPIKGKNGSVTYEKQHDDYGGDVFCSDILPPCPAGQMCVQWGNPMFGTLTFDNVLTSLVNILTVITLEGWTYEMYIIRHATGSYVYDLFFHFIIFIGTFFILNLLVAV